MTDDGAPELSGARKEVLASGREPMLAGAYHAKLTTDARGLYITGIGKPYGFGLPQTRMLFEMMTTAQRERYNHYWLQVAVRWASRALISCEDYFPDDNRPRSKSACTKHCRR